METRDNAGVDCDCQKEKITSVKLFWLNICTKGIPHTVPYIIVLHLPQIRTIAHVLNLVLSTKGIH